MDLEGDPRGVLISGLDEVEFGTLAIEAETLTFRQVSWQSDVGGSMLIQNGPRWTDDLVVDLDPDEWPPVGAGYLGGLLDK